LQCLNVHYGNVLPEEVHQDSGKDEEVHQDSGKDEEVHQDSGKDEERLARTLVKMRNTAYSMSTHVSTQVGKLVSMEMTVQQAALHLNVSVNTVRRRFKVGTQWVLTIDWPGDEVAPTDSATPDQQRKEASSIDADPLLSILGAGHPQQDPETPTLVHDFPPALVHALQSRIDSMELELESRRREIDQLHQLLAAHSLNAGQRKPWWAFWR